MSRMTNKIAIVTGGAVGIGRACVNRLSEEGARVAILDRQEEAGKAYAEELTAKGRDVAFFAADVSDEAAFKSAIDAAVDHFGGLDVMVNNAGVACAQKRTEDYTSEEFDAVQAVNVKGVFFGTKHAIPHIRARGGGAIVNLSSIAGLVGIGNSAPYHASKGAVRLMTKNDAITYAAEGIRINSIHPGYIWTPMVEAALSSMSDDLEAAKAAAGAAHPIGHMGEPDDIAWAVVYLASDQAKFITGAELVVDGGYTAR